MKKLKRQSLLQLLLSHHLDPQENTFCFRGGRICICSRCSGLYPSIIIFTFIFLYNSDLLLHRTGDYLIAYLSILTGCILWTLEKINIVRFNNIKRFITGIILGIGTGWIVALNITYPFSQRVISLLEGATLMVVLSVLIVLIKIV